MEQAIPVIPGDDVSAMRAFYVDGLGFTERWGFSENGRDGMLGVERNGMRITIDCPMTGHGRKACVSLEVEDADWYYEEWRQRVPVPEAPVNEEWGARTFSVHDPAGNTIFVIGPVPPGGDV